MLDKYQKLKITELLEKLNTEMINTDLTFAQIYSSILRAKYIRNGISKDPYDMSDEDFEKAVTQTLIEIKDLDDKV